MEKNLRTTELRQQEGLVKEAAIAALGGDTSLGYTLVASSPRRSLSGVKYMAGGVLAILAALAYGLVVLIQNAFKEAGSSGWAFHWGWDLLALAAGSAALLGGIRNFFSINAGTQAVAVFDGAVLRTGPASWFTQRLSALVYTGPIMANIVVPIKAHHAAKNSEVELGFIFTIRCHVENALEIVRIGVGVAWLALTSKIAALCAEALPSRDYETIMAADLQDDIEWQARLAQALAASGATGVLACLSFALADVRPPEYLRQEEERARQARAAEEQRVANHRSVFETRRQAAANEADFAKIAADIKAANLPAEIAAEETAAMNKAKREFKEQAKRLETEARERVRQAACGPVQAFITGLQDASPLLDQLVEAYHEDPVRMAIFLEAQKLLGGNLQSGSPSLLSLADVAREQSRLKRIFSDEAGEPKKLSIRFAEEPDDQESNPDLNGHASPAAETPSGGPDEDKERLGTAPLASAV